MFGSSRKNRTPAQPLTKETANPNAATAAASAFMRREPSTSLSSAAAAAALRSRPTTPTNVAEVQSRRTASRRSPSVSSTASRGRDRNRDLRELRRSPSTGSMTERTFRSPSPGRGPAPTQQDVPPVPSLPDQSQVRPQRPTSSHTAGARATTLQTQNFRTASQKQKEGDRGSWFSAAAARDGASARRSDAILESSPHGSHARSGSLSPSINFSYPRAREAELASDSADADHTLVYDANSRRMVPKIDLMRRSQTVREASEKTVKQKGRSEISRSGSHLSKGTVGRTKQGLVEPARSVRHSTPPILPSASISAVVPPLARLDDKEPDSDLEDEPASSQSKLGPLETTTEPVSSRLALEATGSDATYPSPEKESSATRSHDQANAAEEKTGTRSLDSPSDDELSQPHHSIDAAPVRSTVATLDAPSSMQGPDSAESKAPKDAKLEPAVPEPSQQHGSVRRMRMHSESPARSPGRSAHFATATDHLLVRHEPPPRSLSPRKSALKQSSSVREASPSDDSSEVSEQPVASSSREEQARKKSVRVSFNDDSNVIVGEAAEPAPPDSPVVLSPQMKKSWHNILGRHKKDSTAVEEEETMTPRPALPLFGSVRDKKAREPDSERPLVRPSERSWSPPPESSTTEQADPAAETSTDAGIGSVVASEAASRNEANISRTREPLPPVVTSVEGTGCDSSLLMTSDEEEMDDSHDTATSAITEPTAEVSPNKERGPPEPVEGTLPNSAGVPDQLLPDSTVKQANGSAEDVITASVNEERAGIPSISIINPSPLAKENSPTSPYFEYFDVPGGFPQDDRPSPARNAHKSTVAEQSAPIAATVVGSDTGIATDVAIDNATPVTPTRTEPAIAIPPMADIQEEEESTGGSSIYSDAFEDMSDAEAGGFMSLDAVLTAPADSKVSRLFEKTKRKSQEANNTLPPGPSEESEAEKDPADTHEDWENAKAYWRGLTLEKRRQLEIEALEEAGEEADQEAVPKQKKKTKKRKSIDRPLPDSKTSEVEQDPDRTYQIQPGTSWAYEEEPPADNRERPDQTAAIPAAAPKFRKSMRGEQPTQNNSNQKSQVTGGLRKSMRSGGTSDGGKGSTLTKASVAPPTTHQSATARDPARNTKRAQSSDGRPYSSAGLASSSTRPTLRRRGSDSSESSFKRIRPASQGFGFRGSMRAGTQEPESPISATKGSGRFSLRSLSPTGSAFRRSSFTSPSSQTQSVAPAGSRMRHSMRNGSTAGKESKKRASALGRLSGKKEKQGKGGSRFVDSSDEEDGGHPFFSSRFADSSDEEEAAAPAPTGGFAKSMRPSRGANSAAAAALGVTPSQQRSDSPDLPDSDDDIVQPKRNTLTNGSNGRAAGNLQRSRSGRGSLAPTAIPGQLDVDGVGERPTHKRRGSFMSSILRRKKPDTNRIGRDVGESAARRDTRLERSTDHLQVIRSNSGGHQKLHKRDISWPLPDQNVEEPRPPTNGEPQRPATSAGPGTTAAKPGFLKRRSTSNQVVPGAPGSLPPPELSEVHKGKKFGKLRKMFGLSD